MASSSLSPSSFFSALIFKALMYFATDWYILD
jgi:hypothetical protein